MAGPTPQGKVQEKEEYLTRFQKFQLVEKQRDALVEVRLAQRCLALHKNLLIPCVHSRRSL